MRSPEGPGEHRSPMRATCTQGHRHRMPAWTCSRPFLCRVQGAAVGVGLAAAGHTTPKSQWERGDPPSACAWHSRTSTWEPPGLPSTSARGEREDTPTEGVARGHLTPRERGPGRWHRPGRLLACRGGAPGSSHRWAIRLHQPQLRCLLLYPHTAQAGPGRTQPLPRGQRAARGPRQLRPPRLCPTPWEDPGPSLWLRGQHPPTRPHPPGDGPPAPWGRGELCTSFPGARF